MDTWRTSTYSFAMGNCVECGSFRRSAHCEGGACVECGTGPGIAVRDTKQEDQGYPVILHFSANAWTAFTDGIKNDGSRKLSRCRRCWLQTYPNRSSQSADRPASRSWMSLKELSVSPPNVCRFPVPDGA